jgi:CBS-domain-containing membrane protein
VTERSTQAHPESRDSSAPAWLQSKAPARLKTPALLLATATSVIALVVLVAIGTGIDRTVLIPPLAASMALVAGAGSTPLAQPRNVIGGQLLSALTGYLVVAVAGASDWSSAVAGGLALGVMLLCRVAHSPAAATAVIVASEHPPIVPFLPLLALGTVVLVLVGIAGSRLGKQKYPTYWW